VHRELLAADRREVLGAAERLRGNVLQFLERVAARSVRGSRILVIGVAYKPNIGDIRESPAIEVASRLQSRGALVAV